MSSRNTFWGQRSLAFAVGLKSTALKYTPFGVSAVLVSAVVLGLSFGATPGFAADKKKAASNEKNAWIKICDAVKLKDVKTKKMTEKKICMTHHESLSTRTGQPLVSAAVRNVSGHDKERFLVTVRLGMVIPAGVHVKVDDGETIKLKYSFCHVAGCVAETEMTPALMKQLKAGKGIKISTIGISGKPILFPVPLTGFDRAYSGKPIDSKKYADAKKQMIIEIRKRQLEVAKKAKAKKDAEILKNADKAPVKK